MRDIHLHGILGEKFGPKHRLAVETAGEAVSAICANFPEAIEIIRDHDWHLVRGDIDDGMSLDIDAVNGLRLGSGDLHIVPAVAGAKNRSGMKVVLGIALMGVSLGLGGVGVLGQAFAPAMGISTTWGGAVGMLGLSMTLTGISGLLAPEIESEEEEENDIFSSLASTAQEGSRMPILYGEMIVPGIPISINLDIESNVSATITTPAETAETVFTEADIPYTSVSQSDGEES